MKLGLYQGPPIQGDVEDGFARIEQQLEAAVLAGARMVVFPELFLPGYNQPNLHASLSQPLGGPWCKRLSALARKAACGLAIGWAEREGAAVYNAATAFGPAGDVLAHYRKIQLFGPMERASFNHGDAHSVFEFEGRRCALMICYDVEFAHHVRALSKKGVSLVLVPTANPAGFENVARLTVPAQAFTQAQTIAYANYCGQESDLTFGGHSLIAAPDGSVLAAAHTTETLIVTDIAHDVDPALLSTQLADYRETPE
ncbi:MAG: carbon-nitrogen hydrolase family protein [Pseudomonadota bacterium]